MRRLREVWESFTGERFFERFVGEATPASLGAIRALVATILLASALFESLPATALLPPAVRVKMGTIQWFYAIPGFEALLASVTGLTVLKWTAVALLALAALGIRTRLVVPLAAFAYYLVAGILRQYAWFYHTGLVPLYVLIVLSFAPCGDGFSVDAWLAQRRGRPLADPCPAPVYGWARWACWFAIAMPYFLAGLSKLRFGGLEWWTPLNMSNILVHTSVDRAYFDFDGGIWLLRHAPLWVFGALGLAAVAAEVGYISVLFSRRARMIFPVVTALMHVGILFLQNIPFFDLIPIQLAFFEVERLWTRRHAEKPAAVFAKTSPEELGRLASWPRGLALAALALVAVWAAKTEQYPFTTMQMFTRVDTSGIVSYKALRAYTESGAMIDPPIDEALPAPGATRHRRTMWKLMDPRRREAAAEFFDVVAALMNRDRPAGEKIVRFEVVKKEWDYIHDPHDPEHGKVVDRAVHDVRPRPDLAGASWR